MKRLLVLLPIAACWRGEPAPAPTTVATVKTAAPAEETPCEPFDEHNPSCYGECPLEAPQIWPACMRKMDELHQLGYQCTGNHPQTCTAPISTACPVTGPWPPNCVPPTVSTVCPATGCIAVTARVIAFAMTGGRIEITMSAGSDQGVSRTWTARVTDKTTPIPGGTVTLIRIDKRISIGTVLLTKQQLERTPYVLLQP